MIHSTKINETDFIIGSYLGNEAMLAVAEAAGIPDCRDVDMIIERVRELNEGCGHICFYCGLASALEVVNTEMKSLFQDTLICQSCGVKFTGIDSRLSHSKIFHPVELPYDDKLDGQE